MCAERSLNHGCDLLIVKALSQGFLDGGARFVANYPGWHSHEILDEMVFEAESMHAPLVNVRMPLNEKVAYEMAYGASLAGLRSVVTFKNYGLNVAADPFFNSFLTGVNAGIVVVVTDDMDVMASQGRQDSRYFRSFHEGLWLEPVSAMQAYAMARDALAASEQLDQPVVIRLTNVHFEWKHEIPLWERLRGLPLASCGEYKGMVTAAIDPRKFVVHPRTWRAQYEVMPSKRARVQKWVDSWPWVTETLNETFIPDFPYYSHAPTDGFSSPSDHVNLTSPSISNPVGNPYTLRLVFGGSRGCHVQASDETILRLGTYPPPTQLLSYAAQYNRVVVEEMGERYACALVEAGLIRRVASPRVVAHSSELPDHSDLVIVWAGLSKLYSALAALKPRHVVADLGQSTQESTDTVTSCLCLGSAVSVACGIALACTDYPYCVCGDAALLHAGGRSLLDEVAASGARFCIVVVDNGGSASTGGQAHHTDLRLHLPASTLTLEYSATTEAAFRDILEAGRSHQRLLIIRLVAPSSTEGRSPAFSPTAG